MNPSGGFFYHYLAFRFRNTIWKFHRQQVRDLLNAWNPSQSKLVLVGPSGGYSLPLKFLEQFQVIHIFEPDLLARMIFQFRFKKIKNQFQFHDENMFEQTHGEFDFLKTKAVLDLYPDCAILFCNILGQLKVIYPESVEKPSFAQWKTHLSQSEYSSRVASYHDRWSTDVKPTHLEQSTLSDAFFEGIFVPNPIEVIDHMTDGLFMEHQKKYWVWSLFPKGHHVIEGAIPSKIKSFGT